MELLHLTYHTGVINRGGATPMQAKWIKLDLGFEKQYYMLCTEKKFSCALRRLDIIFVCPVYVVKSMYACFQDKFYLETPISKWRANVLGLQCQKSC